MNQEKSVVMTSFELPKKLHIELKMMCILTHKSMGEFIRICVREKISQLKNSNIHIEN